MGGAQDLLGQVLGGRYQLIEHTRPGRYGDFWKARRTRDDATVLIKTLRPDLYQDGQASTRFQREARILTGFHHPNLLLVLDQGRTDAGAPFMVLEYKEGRLLSELIGELALSVDRVCHIAMQIAAALAAAHTRGIVHRGLDPDAILLCKQHGDPDHVKLLDFGAAHLTAESGEAQLTRVGQRLGRPEYMAPEYIEAFQLDARSDVYVLGVITFEMLTGQPPFVGPTRSVMMKHVEAEPWPPSELSEQAVPGWLDALVLAMLAKEPDDRPQSGLQVARAFTYGKFPL